MELREHIPLKQGLRLLPRFVVCDEWYSAPRASSIKTRIKTTAVDLPEEILRISESIFH